MAKDKESKKERPIKKHTHLRIYRDLIIIISLFVLLSYFDIFEKFHDFLQAYERFELDELLLILIYFAISLALFSRRRGIELKHHIAKQKHVEKALGESEERFRSLVETTSDLIWEVDKNGVYVYSSPVFKKLLGYESGEIIGKTPFDLMPPDEAERVKEIFEEIVTSQKPFSNLEDINLHKDGRAVVLETSGVPIFDSSGIFQGYRGMCRDITERKRTEEALRKSEEKFSKIFFASPAAITITTLKDGWLIDFNEGFEKITGYSREEAINKKLFDLNIYAYPEERSALINILNEKGNARDFEFHVRIKSGEILNCITSIELIELNNETHLVAVTRDITHFKRAEKEIKQKREQLQTLYETGKKITSLVSKDELLPWIARQAVMLLDTDACHYRLRQGDYLTIGGGTEEGVKLMIKKDLKIGESASGVIAKEKKHITIENLIENDPWHIKEHREIAIKLGFVSFLGVPMKIGDEVVGVVNIYSKRMRKFTESDIGLLSSFADMAAIALENARLFGDLKEAKTEIEKSEKNLKEFSGKILSVREDEKKRLASDLHDEVGSMSFALNSLLCIAIKSTEQNKTEKAVENINKAKVMIESFATNLKNIAADLRPMDLDIVGLPDALKKHFSNIEQHTDIDIDFTFNIENEELCDETAIVLCRVAQEALNNISKHAKADKVTIRLYSENDHIKFNICDNGAGFDIKEGLEQHSELPRMGIIGMRERVESLGGNFSIESARKEGTKISVNLPLT